jgi:uncharacterized protein (DUF1810 family)
MADSTDPHDLRRFVQAQEPIYERALAEIRAGKKESHWMWFIFPQIEGLGSSETTARYAVKSRDEAAAYLEHPVLGARLVECAEAVLAVQGRSAWAIFRHPDDFKLLSSATLFALVSPPGSVFHRLIDTYFEGEPDRATLRLLGIADLPAAGL